MAIIDTADYAKGLGVSEGMFRQAMVYRRTGDDSPRWVTPRVKQIAAGIAPPTRYSGRSPLWDSEDIEAFEASQSPPAPPAGRKVITSREYAGRLGLTMTQFEAARRGDTDTPGGVPVAPPSLDSAGNSHEALWHAADIERFEQRAAGEAPETGERPAPSILTAADYASLLGESYKMFLLARGYQRDPDTAPDYPSLRRLAERIAQPTRILDDKRRTEVWAVEDASP